MKFSRTTVRQWGVAYAFLLPTLLVLGVFQFYPITQAFWISLYEYSPLRPGDTKFIGLENYKDLLSDSDFHRAALNSVLYLLVVPVIIVLSLGLAILVEPKLRFIGVFRAVFYTPVVTMMIVVGIVWGLIFNTDYGLTNTILQRLGLIDEGLPWLTSPKFALWTVMGVTIWKGLGYYMVLFLVGLRAVPPEQREAASIDGAGRWAVFRHVTLPALWPTISLVAVLSSISALQVFEEIYIMTFGRIDTSTVVFKIFETGFSMQSGGGLRMGYACAMGVVLFAAVFTMTSFSTKRLEGMYTS